MPHLDRIASSHLNVDLTSSGRFAKKIKSYSTFDIPSVGTAERELMSFFNESIILIIIVYKKYLVITNVVLDPADNGP